jgi:hypothetical protein
MHCGLVRIERSELDAWGAGVDASSASKDKYPKRTIQFTVFDSSDGVRTTAETGSSSPTVGKSSDGKMLSSRLRKSRRIAGLLRNAGGTPEPSQPILKAYRRFGILIQIIFGFASLRVPLVASNTAMVGSVAILK